MGGKALTPLSRAMQCNGVGLCESEAVHVVLGRLSQDGGVRNFNAAIRLARLPKLRVRTRQPPPRIAFSAPGAGLRDKELPEVEPVIEALSLLEQSKPLLDVACLRHPRWLVQKP